MPSPSQTHLQRHLLSLLGVAGLSACELPKLGPTYDDVACLEVASDAECPDGNGKPQQGSESQPDITGQQAGSNEAGQT